MEKMTLKEWFTKNNIQQCFWTNLKGPGMGVMNADLTGFSSLWLESKVTINGKIATVKNKKLHMTFEMIL